MTTRKTTKKALLGSLLALVLCFSMLVGTTFAWFTDYEVNGGNRIEAGTLDIEMYEILDDGTERDLSLDAAEPVFNYDKWEPGYTDYATLKITNEGTLALKYRLDLISVVDDVNAELADVIDVYMAFGDQDPANMQDLSAFWHAGTLSEMLAKTQDDVDDAIDQEGFTQGVLLPKSEGTLGEALVENGVAYGAIGEVTCTVLLHMQEEAGNKYQGLSLGDDIDIKLYATQYTYEEDVWGNQYDANAIYNDDNSDEFNVRKQL